MSLYSASTHSPTTRDSTNLEAYVDASRIASCFACWLQVRQHAYVRPVRAGWLACWPIWISLTRVSANNRTQSFNALIRLTSSRSNLFAIMQRVLALLGKSVQWGGASCRPAATQPWSWPRGIWSRGIEQPISCGQACLPWPLPQR